MMRLPPSHLIEAGFSLEPGLGWNVARYVWLERLMFSSVMVWSVFFPHLVAVSRHSANDRKLILTVPAEKVKAAFAVVAVAHKDKTNALLAKNVVITLIATAPLG